jgi:hypothetical protein
MSLYGWNLAGAREARGIWGAGMGKLPGVGVDNWAPFGEKDRFVLESLSLGKDAHESI